MAPKMIHDYTKPAVVNRLLLNALDSLSSSDSPGIRVAREFIGSARQMLDEYLSSDNLIPDDDE